MAKYESQALRNVAVAGHGGTGKTTLCESFLFVSGKTERLGRVDDGSSSMDFEPEAHKRRSSINTAVNFFEWDKHKVNLLDSPGDSNFAYDMMGCLAHADAVLVVIDAVSGVEFQRSKPGKPPLPIRCPGYAVINRLDRERADFGKAVESSGANSPEGHPLMLPSPRSLIQGRGETGGRESLSSSTRERDLQAGGHPRDLAAQVENYRGTMVMTSPKRTKPHGQVPGIGRAQHRRASAGTAEGVLSGPCPGRLARPPSRTSAPPS